MLEDLPYPVERRSEKIFRRGRKREMKEEAASEWWISIKNKYKEWGKIWLKKDNEDEHAKNVIIVRVSSIGGIDPFGPEINSTAG